MAFGFRRAPGSSRGYVNEATGERVSRRQYDKHVERLGKRLHMPGADAIAATEHLLEDMRGRLAAISAREAEVSRRELELDLRARELELEKMLFRKGRTSAGQRRYNAVLDAYTQEQRRQGRKLTKTQARTEARFAQIMRDIKGKPNRGKSATIADENRFTRMKALDQLGGSNAFREYYEKMYGTLLSGRSGENARASARNRSQGILANGRSRFTVRRRVA